jgi:glycosyltransferase involved in cell wall biosynthesis
VAERGFGIDVIGRGPSEAALSEAIGSVPGLAEAILLHGFLADNDKRDIVAGSLLHLNTSQGEGWGLCVLEAAALGVPTVAYDVAGLRDAVRDGETGWLVKDGEQLADVVERAAGELADPARRDQVAARCRAWAARLSWDRAVIVSLSGDGIVAEGPVLDALVASGEKVLRPATATERLLGEVASSPGPP